MKLLSAAACSRDKFHRTPHRNEQATHARRLFAFCRDPHEMRRFSRDLRRYRSMSAFGPSPIQPLMPSVVQSSLIAQQASNAKARVKNKLQDADPKRPLIHDELRLTDPMRVEEVDFKPDAVEEWKHRRQRAGHVDPRFIAADTQGPSDETSHLDVKG